MRIVLFVVSAVLLALSVFQTRLFSIIFWHTDAFTVMSLCMLASGAGGLWAFFVPSLRNGRRRRDILPILLPILSVSLLLSHFTILHLPELSPNWGATAATAVAMLPFFLGGFILGTAIASQPESISGFYFWDMLGASAGALGALPLIEAMNGPRAIAVLSEILLAVSMWLCLTDRRRLAFRVCKWLVPALALFIFAPDVANSLRVRFAKGRVLLEPELEIWSPSGRVTAVGSMPKFLLVDATGLSPVIEGGQNFEKTTFLKHSILQLGHALGPFKKVAVLGSGGGSDIVASLIEGAESIAAVEINDGIARAMTKDLLLFSGNVYGRRQVKLISAEARSFMAGQTEKFDLIQASFVDTYAASGGGAYTLSESYLYTTDAMRELLQRLKPGGVLSFSRWGGGAMGFAETERIIAIAERVLRLDGKDDPSSHALAVLSGASDQDRIALRSRAF